MINAPTFIFVKNKRFIFAAIFNNDKIIIMIVFILLLVPFVWSSEYSTVEMEWMDKDKEVYILQNRLHRKKSRFFAMAGSGTVFNAPFVDSYFFTGKVGHFFTEEIGVEIIYSAFGGSENVNAKSVKSTGTVPFYRKTKSIFGGNLLWSPFYAKINIFDQIVYFDWIIGAGLGQLKEENNREEFNTRSASAPLTEETHTSFQLLTHFQIYLTKMITMQLSYLESRYSAGSPLLGQENVDENYSVKEFGLSLGLLF